jgi:hypothetical protein
MLRGQPKKVAEIMERGHRTRLASACGVGAQLVLKKGSSNTIGVPHPLVAQLKTCKPYLTVCLVSVGRGKCDGTTSHGRLARRFRDH